MRIAETNLPVLPRRRRPRRSLEAAGVLATARAAQADVQDAEARKLSAAAEWCRLHEVDDADLAETWDLTPITLGGDGVPMVARGCVAEFAAVIGISTNGGRAYLADALELAHRLPSVYGEVLAGRLSAWKARRIASETPELPAHAASDLDRRIAPLAARLSGAATQRMIDEALEAASPGHAQETSDRFANHKVVVDHRQVSFIGTSQLYGALDVADALDLDVALNAEAEAMRLAGNTETLDVRRAAALGRLARGDVVGRTVTLYVHLPADTTRTTATLENAGSHLLTQAQVASWCSQPGVTVFVKPVIDLSEQLSTVAYAIPDRIKERVILRDRICAFPHCGKLARWCQQDHTRPYGSGGATSTENLAPLCQHHHNLKTHAGWSYVPLKPGTYLWRSPHGYEFVTNREGTQDLTPRPLEPPG